MEVADDLKAILATLSFFDLFDYPLTASEVFFYLIDLRSFLNGQFKNKPGLTKVETRSKLEELVSLGQVSQQNDFYFLPGREEIIKIREERRTITLKKIRRVQKMAKFLSILPFIKLVALGNVMGHLNLKKESDLDLFIITTKGRIWLARWWPVGIAKLLNLRPLPDNTRNKFCFSFFVTEDNLDLEKLALKQDIYFYYWLANLVVVYDAGDYFAKFIHANHWLKKYLPQVWLARLDSRLDSAKRAARQATAEARQATNVAEENYRINPSWLWMKKWWEMLSWGMDENFVRQVQRLYLPLKLRQASQQGVGVIINDKILKFHLNDRREEVRDRWVGKLKKAGIKVL